MNYFIYSDGTRIPLFKKIPTHYTDKKRVRMYGDRFSTGEKRANQRFKMSLGIFCIIAKMWNTLVRFNPKFTIHT